MKVKDLLALGRGKLQEKFVSRTKHRDVQFNDATPRVVISDFFQFCLKEGGGRIEGNVAR